MFVLATIDVRTVRTIDIQKRAIRKSLKFIILVLNEPNDIEILLCTTV